MTRARRSPRFFAAPSPLLAVATAVATAWLTGCTVGEGSGTVQSDELFIQNCWRGQFDLRPDFFAAVPNQRDGLMIRIQRGSDISVMSDGLMAQINGVSDIRQHLGEKISI